MKAIYRNHTIEPRQTDYAIFKNGVLVCAQPSLEFAKKWIDRELQGEGASAVTARR